jgi:hypothetical protein
MKSAKPNKGEDGRIYADEDGGWYYLTEILENGDEKRTLSTNALFHAQESATCFSVGKKNWAIETSNILLIDGKTHQAIAFYKQDKGLQAGWEEKNHTRAKSRQAAYKERRSLIEFPAKE